MARCLVVNDRLPGIAIAGLRARRVFAVQTNPGLLGPHCQCTMHYA